ncbi:Maf family protein [Quadrisphaera sp. KR29]|uniref:Maf family protein n=1 Tax=Quadrisphaera sp. KR29 TaxID=3461391 RepID=UPI00404418C2
MTAAAGGAGRPVLLLASASPARAATLRAAGVEPLVLVSGVDEPAVVERYGVTDPQDVALVLAKAKAEDVAARWEEADGAPDGGVLVVGCDSVLELDGQAFGKPADAAQALERWKGMRGRSGVLHTGHWLVDAREDDDGPVTGATLGAVASTTVHFADVTDAELEAYVATGEPLAVAGAFTLDGLGGAFVRGVEGDPHTVVGIGLPLLRELLGEVGVRWTDLWALRP